MMHGKPLGGFYIEFPAWVGPITPVEVEGEYRNKPTREGVADVAGYLFKDLYFLREAQKRVTRVTALRDEQEPGSMHRALWEDELLEARALLESAVENYSFSCNDFERVKSGAYIW